MKPPLSFIYGNCVFARSLHDGWAAFAVELSSYAWLDPDAKHGRFLALLGALDAVEADIQILRVSRRGPSANAHAEPDGRLTRAQAQALASYRTAEARRLRELDSSQPLLFVLVSLAEPERDVASVVSEALGKEPRGWRAALRALGAARERRMLDAGELEQAWLRAEKAQACLAQFLPVRPVEGTELQWLVRRAFCRGLGEPPLDALHEPRALAVERNGQARLAPLEADVMRWCDSVVSVGTRTLHVESEQGGGWQAQLVAGALPDSTTFPGSRAELMFAPVESLPFPVDLSLNARYVPNELASRIARRRIQDADQILRAEAEGEQGASDLGRERTQHARDLLAHLRSSSRPPLLRATLAVAIGADSERLLEERVEACRRAFGDVRLHRPPGSQLQLFLQHLPAQRTRVAGYDDMLTTEQVAAMMPTAAHRVGSARGFHLGHTTSGSSQPVRLNLREGSDGDRNVTVLCIGALGTGKTTLAQKLAYEAFLQGARVIDCDPKGDHRFHALAPVAPHVEEVVLRPDPALRGMLDPLRVAPAHLRHDATVSFLCDLLPGRAEPAWETAVVAAVDRVASRSARPTSLEVVRTLEQGDEIDVKVAKALSVYARSGLTQLGFADPAAPPPAVGDSQVTYMAIRDLPAPPPQARRSEWSQAERVGAQIVRLIAMFAMHLMGVERRRLKIFCFDEGWRLLGDPVGRALLAALQRMGRSELAVPIIGTQLVTDALLGERESLENLIGATFVFGMRSQAEAGRALSLLGLDPEDAGLCRRLMELDAGRCLFRDHRGRIEEIQVELVLPSLLRELSTTPTG